MKLLSPENRREIPRAALGLILGLAEMVLYETGIKKVPGPTETQPASIQYFTTGEEVADGTGQ